MRLPKLKKNVMKPEQASEVLSWLFKKVKFDMSTLKDEDVMFAQKLLVFLLNDALANGVDDGKAARMKPGTKREIGKFLKKQGKKLVKTDDKEKLQTLIEDPKVTKESYKRLLKRYTQIWTERAGGGELKYK